MEMASTLMIRGYVPVFCSRMLQFGAYHGHGMRWTDLHNSSQKCCGRGILTFLFTLSFAESVQAKYEGSLKEGKKSGKGKFTWPSGEIYDGEVWITQKDAFTNHASVFKPQECALCDIQWQ
jgi:hypothetical protein